MRGLEASIEMPAWDTTPPSASTVELFSEAKRVHRDFTLSNCVCVCCVVERCLLIHVPAARQHLTGMLYKLSLQERIFT